MPLRTLFSVVNVFHCKYIKIDKEIKIKKPYLTSLIM